MTGFGRAERSGSAVAAHVEVRSVNARHLKVSCRVPASIESGQQALESRVREHCERGTVTVFIRVERTTGRAPARIDPAVLADYVEQLRGAARIAGLSTEVDLASLVRLPGALVDVPQDEDPGEGDLALVVAALDAALEGLVQMRESEGAALAATLGDVLDGIDAQSAAVAGRAPAAILEHRDRMRERLAALLDGSTPVSEELLAREIAVLVEKTDIAEELARLESHIAQTRAALTSGESCGRRLEFLAQEMGREANTIGAKATDQVIRDAGVEMRLLVDRLKEQAANVE